MGTPYETLDMGWRLLQDTNETTSEDEDTVIYDDGQVMRDTMMVYGSILVVILLLFCWARRRFPNVYNLRNWVDPLKSPLAENQHGFFSWMWKVYLVTEDELMVECGMDALCFIRIAQMGYKMTCVGIFNSIWLMIVYATSESVRIDERFSEKLSTTLITFLFSRRSTEL